jgi:hypothetical protein
MSTSQGVLITEPLYTETGVWCELAPGIDPAEWGHLCRHIGTLTPKQFRKAQKKVYGNPDSLINRLRAMFCFEDWETAAVPLVCLGRLEIQRDRNFRRGELSLLVQATSSQRASI